MRNKVHPDPAVILPILPLSSACGRSFSNCPFICSSVSICVYLGFPPYRPHQTRCPSKAPMLIVEFLHYSPKCISLQERRLQCRIIQLWNCCYVVIIYFGELYCLCHVHNCVAQEDEVCPRMRACYKLLRVFSRTRPYRCLRVFPRR